MREVGEESASVRTAGVRLVKNPWFSILDVEKVLECIILNR